MAHGERGARWARVLPGSARRRTPPGRSHVARRLVDLVRRARRLASERDRLVESLAEEWTEALRGLSLSATDLEELWAGLTEEAIRRAGQAPGTWSPEAWRQETQEVISRVRERVEAALGRH